MRKKTEPEHDDREWKNIIVLVAVIALVIFTSWLLIAFRNGTNLLDCLARGSKNCGSTPVWPDPP